MWAASSGRSDSCRLLLGHAVHGAKAPDKVPRIYGDNFAGREELSQRVERKAVIAIVESRNQHRAVADIKVCVAGWQTPSLKYQWRRHGQLQHAQPPPILVF